MDFALQELSNLLAGSVVNAGADRLTNAGSAGIPQMVAPGCLDLIDFAGWEDIPERYSDRPFHEHNRLIKSAGLNGPERRETAQAMAERLMPAKAPVNVLLPLKGLEEWDKEGGPAHDPDALNEFIDETRKVIKAPLTLTEVNAHINDEEFTDTVLALFDAWVSDGTVKRAS